MQQLQWRDEQFTRKDNQNINKQHIEPWFDQPGRIPYSLLSIDTDKPIRKFIKKCSSLQIPSIPVRSPQKNYQKRQQQFLPKMDIGIHTIRKQLKKPQRDLSPKISKSLRKRKMSETVLPSVSINRQLLIERKIYIINNQHQKQLYKTKQTNLRNTIQLQQSKHQRKSINSNKFI